MRKVVIAVVIALFSATTFAQEFKHPGLVVSGESLARMKQYVAQKTEPAYASFLALSKDKRASSDYKMKGPYEIIARDGTYRKTKGGSESDFCAAFYNALMYQLTGDKAHADKALEIINAYSDKLQAVDGHDAPLCCLQGYYLVNAMELMTSPSPSQGGKTAVTPETRRAWAAMIRRAFIPVMDKFEAASPYANGNWGAIVNKMRMAVAIYSDDRQMYNKAKQIFTQCNDNCCLPNYIAEDGQCQETGRDQGHAQLGIGNEAEICEMAWNQGDDLWGLLENRMLKGYEYTAKYNLGYDVPFKTWKDCTGLYNDWTVPGQMGRGKFPCIYELAYAHFVGRKHLEMPYTAMVLGMGGKVRPEVKTGNCDAIGLGSLLFYNGMTVDTVTKTPAVPAFAKIHHVFPYSCQMENGKSASMENSVAKRNLLNDDYDVYIQPRGGKEWTKIDTYKAKVAGSNGSSGTKVSEISYSFFDFEGDVFVKVVTKGRTFKKAQVRPDYRGVIANIQNDSTMQFLLFQPENVSVEFDGDTNHNLLVFTSKPCKTMAEAKKEAKAQKRRFVYYKPGLYQIENGKLYFDRLSNHKNDNSVVKGNSLKVVGDSLMVPSNTTVYLDGGAYFTCTFAINDAENVSILGRGVARPERGYEGCHVYRSKNVLIDGLIVNTCPIGESSDVTLHDVRSISHPQWGDGLNVFGGCRNILFDRVFCRNSDDCHTVYATRKGFKGSVHNVKMTNSTLWADVAHPIMIGLHGAGSLTPQSPLLEARVSDVIGDSIVGLRYENIDILGQNEHQIDYQGCLAINCGDNNVVKDVTFDNIRIEQIMDGSLFHVKTVYNDKYGLAPGKSIEDVMFHCIRYYSHSMIAAPVTVPKLSIISGYSDDRKVKNITFEDLRIDGRKIYDTMPGKPKWYHTSDFVPAYVGPYVEGVKFKE